MSSDRGTPMGHECRLFRSVLERTLREGSAGLAPLHWHEHLLGCGSCSELLRSEEALEVLLTSLPEPHLPPHLAQRVLMRLDASRLDLDLTARDDLDALLDLDREVHAPEGLSARILTGVRSSAASEETRLDALLDRAGSVEVPVGLASRVLASLDEERGLARPSTSGAAPVHSFFTARRAIFAAAAAGLVLWMGSSLLFPGEDGLGEQLAGLEVPDPALLEDLDVLQQYDLLMDSDPDLLIASELDATTEVMLDLTEEL